MHSVEHEEGKEVFPKQNPKLLNIHLFPFYFYNFIKFMEDFFVKLLTSTYNYLIITFLMTRRTTL